MTIQVFTLGTCIIQQNGQTLGGFVSQKTIALFVYLLAHPYEHPREVIAERFWAETTTEQALKNLRTVLSSLQKQLGDYLTITRQSIGIYQPEDIWFDVRVFEEHFKTAQALQARPSSPRKLQTALETALALYRGDFLLGLKTDNAPELDTWLSLERERLNAQMTQARLQLMKVTLKRGHYALGIEQGLRLIASEPFWEEAYRLLMTLYAHANNRNAALQLYDTLCQTLSDELDAEPELDTQTLYQQIKARRIRLQQPHKETQQVLNISRYVPVPTLIEQVMQKLDMPDCRLLTLLGIGGIGKTKLAHFIAQTRFEDYHDGIFFVPLESLTDATFVLQAIISTLRISQVDDTRSAYDTLKTYLKPRHCLLILDNFEHVLPAADDVARLLASCPYLQVMITTREQLHLADEHIIHMTGLPFSEVDMQSPALQLFNLVAQQVDMTFSLDAHLAQVIQICDLVAGLPLGILIAASWTQFLSPTEIVGRIETSLNFLTSQRRDLPDRHRGITALLHSTWDVLKPEERSAIQALAVFPGHFDEEAAQAVANANYDLLGSLVAKALLQADEDGRYHLHELLRRFAHQHVLDDTLLHTIRQRHQHYYRDWVDKLYQEHLPPQTHFSHIDREYHNLWTLDWLPTPHQQYDYLLHLAKVLPDYWLARGYHLKEGIERLKQALPQAQGWLKANVYVRLGRLLAHIAQYTEARDLLEQGLKLSQAQHDLLLEALALAELNRVVFAFGDLELAKTYLYQIITLYENAPPAQQATNALREVFSRAYSNLAVTYLQLANLDQAEKYGLIGLQKQREGNNQLGEAISLNTLGIIALDKNQPDVARSYFESALEIAYTIDHKRHQTVFSGNLAEALHRLGDFDGAYRMYVQTLYRAYQLDNRKTMLNVLEQLANVTLDRHQPQEAARFLGMATALRDTLGLIIAPRQVTEFAQREARLTQSLGKEALQEILDDMQTIPIEAFLETI